MAKKHSCVSCGSLKRFPHTFTRVRSSAHKPTYNQVAVGTDKLVHLIQRLEFFYEYELDSLKF